MIGSRADREGRTVEHPDAFRLGGGAVALADFCGARLRTNDRLRIRRDRDFQVELVALALPSGRDRA